MILDKEQSIGIQEILRTVNKKKKNDLLISNFLFFITLLV